jgi:hypothetical protein
MIVLLIATLVIIISPSLCFKSDSLALPGGPRLRFRKHAGGQNEGGHTGHRERPRKDKGVKAAGGDILMAKTLSKEGIVHTGIFRDSEGNRIGLHSRG